jgi:hypothetical protein
VSEDLESELPDDVEHAEPGRAVWLKDERRFGRLNPTDPAK